MLAALLLNEPGEEQLGGIYGVEERAQKALEALRRQHFERERRGRAKEIVEAAVAAPDEVIKLPIIGDDIPSADARLGSRVDDDEVLAFLLILAKL